MVAGFTSVLDNHIPLDNRLTALSQLPITVRPTAHLALAPFPRQPRPFLMLITPDMGFLSKDERKRIQLMFSLILPQSNWVNYLDP